MQVYITFRHMEPSDPLKEYADEKIRRVIRKYIRDNYDAQVTLSVEKFRHIANFLVTYKGITIRCEESSDDMYSSIDLALDKLERQIRRYKDKLRKHKPSDGRNRQFDFSVIAPIPDDEPEEDEFEEVVEEEEVEEVVEEEKVHVLKREVMTASPMEVDDAIMQLDLEQRSFFVFTNKETSAISVVYRLEDGNFGLIEPR